MSFLSLEMAFDADPGAPWYRPLVGNMSTLRGIPRSSIGRKSTSLILRVLEAVHAVPQGTTETVNILNTAADNLVSGGRLGIFTPMYYHKARKPI